MSHNSLVIMPNARKETWLMEGLLQPCVHHAPLNDPTKTNDLLIWLMSNDEKCQEIVKNANDWMKKFANNKRTRHVHTQILKKIK